MFFCFLVANKKNSAGKSREELALEKQLELERRLMDVSGQLNSGKKPPKNKRKSPCRLLMDSVVEEKYETIDLKCGYIRK